MEEVNINLTFFYPSSPEKNQIERKTFRLQKGLTQGWPTHWQRAFVCMEPFQNALQIF
jgi:hypothetical protein